MTSNVKLKEAFEVESKHGAFYTGGNVEWHGKHLYCQNVSSVSLLDVESGKVTRYIGEEGQLEEVDGVQTFTSDGQITATAHKSGLLKLWDEEGRLVKAWKCIHKGPIAALQIKSDRFLASGGADGIVRIWEMRHQACVSSLRGAQGVVSVVEFVPFADALMASGDDGKVLCWDLEKGAIKYVYNGHFSKVTCLKFHQDDRHFVTCGRDKTVTLWQYGNSTSVRMIPLNEAVESVLCFPLTFKLPNFKPEKGRIYVATGGESGAVRVWDVLNSRPVYTQTNSLISKAKDEGAVAITKMLFDSTQKLTAMITIDHDILVYIVKSFQCIKQFVGFSDEILDVRFMGKNDSHVAVATNSPDIKLYENSTMNCRLLKGHTDLVLALAVPECDRNLLASSGKDNTIRLWRLPVDDEGEETGIACIGVGLRHMASVSSVSFANGNCGFLVSVGLDNCLKMWAVPRSSAEINHCAGLICTRTEIAHEKDINCVTVSPNDRIIATSSQDKTVKLWTDSLSLVGVLRGHKRGVWCVAFSPMDQVVITSSADCTVKLWSVVEFNCLKTFNGHEASVLRANFISNGAQILSAGADGLIKLFNVKTSECTATFDQHEGRIWALDVNEPESGFVTGGSDSLLIKWKDVTTEKREERAKQLEETVLREQQLNNCVREERHLRALKLALQLDKPLQVLHIIERILKKQDTAGLCEIICELSDGQKDDLLRCATVWNTNSKNCQPAQLIFNFLLTQTEEGRFKPAIPLSEWLEGAIPYTERHFNRLTRLLQDLHFIKYTVNCIQPYGADPEQ